MRAHIIDSIKYEVHASYSEVLCHRTIVTWTHRRVIRRRKMDKKRKWGELPSVPDVDAGIAAVEREQLTKLRPIEVEGPRLHQSSSRHCPPTNDLLPAERFELDPLTAHTIRLVQHAKKVRLLISNLQTANQENRNGDTDIQYPTAPPIPEYSGPPLKHNKYGHLPFVPKDYESDFVKGKGEPPPVLDDVTCRHLVQRSVAAIFAHLGFDNCNESVLDTLSCILHEFYLQFTTHLRSAVDSKLLHGHAGFPVSCTVKLWPCFKNSKGQSIFS
ncbi:SUPT7L [Mytilus coruscus]|uniref:SUPT7L n=1 Tax=Mytilus coruscus TaxID=42192 RepID=A0A6J8F142_MYTCO|nr:SUPT7L [Mytilus coruscus]